MLAAARRATVTGRPLLRSNVVGSLSSQARALSGFRYAKTHEYALVEGDTVTIGVSDFAQAQLGDVVYVDLPSVGEEFDQEAVFGSVESVKAASDLYAPVSGVVTEVNETLEEEPGKVNTHAMSDGWFIKMTMSTPSEADSLLDEAAYAKEITDA